MSEGLMAMVEKTAPEDDMDRFEEALFQRLMTPKRPEWNPETDHYDYRLSCDYGPCNVLRDAMEACSLEFSNPIKTNLYISDGAVVVSAGYAAPNIYHYPLDGDRWLVTELRGRDISKVIEYIEGGQPEFIVEECDHEAG